MNEHPNEEQGSEEQGSEAASWETTAPVEHEAASADDASPAQRPAADDPSVTQQHPLTQPVPHIQPPSQPPYPGQPVTVADADVYPAGAHPAPSGTWAPAPAPGTWGVAAAPGWGPTGPTPTPAPGGWGAGVGGVRPADGLAAGSLRVLPGPATSAGPARRTTRPRWLSSPRWWPSWPCCWVRASVTPRGRRTTTAAQTPSSSGGSGTSGGSQFPFGTGGSGGSGVSGSGSSTTGAGAPADVTGIASKISPDLVDINTNLSYQNEQAAGTGIVLTSNGEILTNNHVIDGATSISVTDVGNGQTYKANVVGYDRTGDIAVIQLVGASGLQTAKLASSLPAVGEGVVGVGNAGGTGGTPSSAGGSVTALSQSITASDSGGGNSENLSGLIQMNCDIQPGDSGGALVDAAGSVVGMDTAASTGTTDSGGTAQAYAIPIGTALSVARNIEAGRGGSTIHIGATGFLGIQVQDSSATGLGGTGTSTNGAVVDGTLPGLARGQCRPCPGRRHHRGRQHARSATPPTCPLRSSCTTPAMSSISSGPTSRA